MARDGFKVAKQESLAAAHARIDAYLDQVHREKPKETYSWEIDPANHALGKAILTAPEAERTETTAAALLRYEQLMRGYTGGIYDPETFTVADYVSIVGKLGATLLRTKMLFDEPLLERVVTAVATYAARNVRTYPINGLLGQLEHQLKKRGSLPAGLAKPLQTMAAELAKQAAGYKTTPPPLAITQVRPRVAALIASPRKPAGKPTSKKR
jgi:hypothetical protein